MVAAVVAVVISILVNGFIPLPMYCSKNSFQPLFLNYYQNKVGTLRIVSNRASVCCVGAAVSECTRVWVADASILLAFSNLVTVGPTDNPS